MKKLRCLAMFPIVVKLAMLNAMLAVSLVVLFITWSRPRPLNPEEIKLECDLRVISATEVELLLHNRGEVALSFDARRLFYLNQAQWLRIWSDGKWHDYCGRTICFADTLFKPLQALDPNETLAIRFDLVETHGVKLSSPYRIEYEDEILSEHSDQYIHLTAVITSDAP